jgi:hypothetical protein
MKTVKKAQKGMTMKQLKMKYPSADTTAKGDVRGTEVNAYGPKKAIQQYSDTYNAFQRKFGNKPATDKPVKKTIKKSKNGTSLGMKSVKAGFDKNPGVTRADIIVAAKKQAKKGTKIKKAQDGFMQRAASRRGVCGKGSISDRKAARMDRREERRANREERRSLRGPSFKVGGKLSKAQGGKMVSDTSKPKRNPMFDTMKEKMMMRRKMIQGSPTRGTMTGSGYTPGMGKMGAKVKKTKK